MRIGIIGTGHIGSTLARHFVDAGHEVALANSRGPETLRDKQAALGEQAHATSAEEAARFGELVVVSVPFGRYGDLPTGGSTASWSSTPATTIPTATATAANWTKTAPPPANWSSSTWPAPAS